MYTITFDYFREPVIMISFDSFPGEVYLLRQDWDINKECYGIPEMLNCRHSLRVSIPTIKFLEI